MIENSGGRRLTVVLGASNVISFIAEE